MNFWGYYNLALDHNNPAFVVDANTPRVLKDVRPKLPNKLPVLVVDLDLVRRRPGITQSSYFLSIQRELENKSLIKIFDDEGCESGNWQQHNVSPAQYFLSSSAPENMFLQEALQRRSIIIEWGYILSGLSVCAVCVAMMMRLIRGRRSRYSESNSVFSPTTNQPHFLLTLFPGQCNTVTTKLPYLSIICTKKPLSLTFL